jgi:hypothetical protein
VYSSSISEAAVSLTRGRPLYPTFVVYFKGPYTAQSLSKNFSVISELFYKFKLKFSICQIFLKLFLKIRDLYLNRCPSQILYKYMVTFSIYQIYLYFFLDLTFRVSFITCRCQIFYKCKYKYLTEQVKSDFF